MRISHLAFFLMLLAFTPLTALAAESIGSVSNSSGLAEIIRDGRTLPAGKGAELFAQDRVRTGDNGSLGIILRDDTTLSLGPRSEADLREFAFKPKEKRFAFVARLVRGTFSYLSGVIGKLSPESIRLETPEATIAVRGTRLLIQVEDP